MIRRFTYLPTPEARNLAQELAALRGHMETVQAGMRSTQLGNSTLHDGYLIVRDSDGVIRQVIGRQADGTYGEVAANGPPPSRPNTPDVVPIMAGLEIRWNGTLVDALPQDFSHILVYVSGAGPSFISGPSNLAGTLFRAGSLPVVPLPYTEHWARFVAVNTSGEESEESLTASGTPSQVVGADVLDGIVTETKLAADAVTAAKIATGAVTETKIADDAVTTPKIVAGAVEAGQIAAGAVQAGKIAANAVTAEKIAALAVEAGKIAANAVTAGTIEAGAVETAKLAALMVLANRIVVGDPAAARFELNGTTNEVAAYATDGTTKTVDIDGNTGAATFLGEFRTALTGDRVTINPDNSVWTNTIRWTIGATGHNAEIAASKDTNNDQSFIALYNADPAGNIPDGSRIYRGGGTAAMDFMTNGGSVVTSGRGVTQNSTIDRSRLNFMIANAQYGTGTPANVFMHEGITGAELSGARLQHINLTNDAFLYATTQSVGIRFGLNSGNGALFVKAGNGSTARPIFASAFTVDSGRATKQNIKDLDQSALDIVMAAPVKEWEYKPDPVRTEQVEELSGSMREGRKKTRTVTIPSETPVRHVGPMAEDLPDNVVRTGDDGPAIDIRDMLGVLWQAVQELAGQVTELTQRVGESGPRPPRT